MDIFQCHEIKFFEKKKKKKKIVKQTMNLQISQSIIALAFIHVVVSFIVICATPLKIKQVGDYFKIGVSSKFLWLVSFLVVLSIGILAVIEYQDLNQEGYNLVKDTEEEQIEEQEKVSSEES